MYSMNIIHNKCVFFKISSAAKVAFLGVGRSSKENLSLPYSLLLDYSTLSSLPYPTLLEIEKPLLVGAWPGVNKDKSPLITEQLVTALPPPPLFKNCNGSDVYTGTGDSLRKN